MTILQEWPNLGRHTVTFALGSSSLAQTHPLGNCSHDKKICHDTSNFEYKLFLMLNPYPLVDGILFFLFGIVLNTI